MSNYKIERAINKEDLTLKTVQTILAQINAVLSRKERAQIALSGGSTPSDVYKLLSSEKINWSRVDIFLGDERWVDPADPLSNALMIRNTFLSSLPGSQASFHAVPTTQLSSPKSSAIAFEEILNQKCIGSPPVFDLILLGLGEDGHTASLFPFTSALKVTDKWATTSKGKGCDRITLTAPVLSAATKVIFLVSGASKQIALKRLMDPSESPDRTPAKLVQPFDEILVLADQAALNLV